MRLKSLAENPLIEQARLADPEFEVERLECDSRLVARGDAFYALPGMREDGHRFIDRAVEAGAAVLFVSDEGCFERLSAQPPAGVAGVLRVPPGRAALADAAHLVAGAPSRRLHLLGVTGTSGKTTVSHLAAQLYGTLGKPCGVIGSLGMFRGDRAADTARTTPEAPVIASFLRECADAGLRQVTIEATSIGIELERTRNLKFRAAAFTNLSQDHLDFHGSMAAYAAAKERLFLEGEVGQAVVNVDDPAGRNLIARLAGERPQLPLLTYGFGADADLRAETVTAETRGSRGELCLGRARAPFRTTLLGRFNLANLLAAVGLLLAAGEELAPVADAVEACTGVAGRFEQVPCGATFTAVVDYSHKPDALENALLTARQIAQGRVLVVFGCGGERDAGKRPLMGEIAQRLADVAVITSDNPRGERPGEIIAQIAQGMRKDGGDAARIEDRREAIFHTLGQARQGDVVLIAGKGHETYQEIAGEKRPFDDREVVKAWAQSRPGGAREG